VIGLLLLLLSDPSDGSWPYAPEPGSPVALGQGVILGGGALEHGGRRPNLDGTTSALDGPTEIRFELRGGTSSGQADTVLGTQLGVEYGLLFGVAVGGDSHLNGPIEVAARLGLALRSFTWTLPVPGMLAFFLDSELSGGGREWWSDGARVSLLPGGRLAFCGGARCLWHLELEYAIAPHVLGPSPDGLDVNRFEHRALATLGWGALGVGARFLISREQTRAPMSAVPVVTHEDAIGAVIEWRQ
jgi:hypothetical protein